MMRKLLFGLLTSLALVAPAYGLDRSYRGIGSEYGHGDGFHGRRTASGERFNKWAMTCASRGLPFGTMVRVTNLRTGRSVVLRVNDRGPFTKNRIIDISHAAAKRIGMDGIAPVRVDVLQRGY